MEHKNVMERIGYPDIVDAFLRCISPSLRQECWPALRGWSLCSMVSTFIPASKVRVPFLFNADSSRHGRSMVAEDNLQTDSTI